jgi:beta-galactosidase
MKNRIILLLLILLPFSLEAKDKLLTDYDIQHLVPSNQRIVTSLSGNWDVSFDDGQTWGTTAIPASHYSENQIIYRRTVKIDKNIVNEKAWHLYFLGVNNQIDIYVNDEFIGRHYGYGAPFIVDIPSRAITGESNTLQIVATQAEHFEGFARHLANQAQKSYVGILRDILLIGSESVWIDNVLPTCEINSTHTTSVVNLKMEISSDNIVNAIETKEPEVIDSTAATIATAVEAEPNPDADIKGLFLKIRAIDPVNFDTTRYFRSEAFILQSERTEEVEMAIRINNPIVWNMENPHLYRFEIELYRDGNLVDDYILNYGIKDLKTRANRFTLNGKELPIKGVEYYDDIQDTDFTLTAARVRKDLKLIQLMGANTVTFGSHAPHPLMASLCDSLGLMMMLGTPVSSIPDGNLILEEIRVTSSNIIDQMIKHFQKHTSVVAYRLSDRINESNPATHEFNKETARRIKLISDKLIYKQVLLNSNSVKTDNLDFIVFSHTSVETIFPKLDQRVKELAKTIQNKPVLFLYGTICNPENHNGYADPLSIDYQAYNFSQCYKISENNNLAGNIVHSFNDYLFENPVLSTDYQNRELSTSGMFSRDRKFRISFNTMQALYTGKTEPLLNSGSLEDDSLVPVLFMVLTLLMIALLFLFLNQIPRFREYFVRSLTKPYNFYADIRDQRIISSIQTIILAVFISLSVAIYLTSCIYINRTEEIMQNLLTAALPFGFMKQFIYDLVWKPQLMMFMFAGIFFIKMLLAAFLIKIMAGILRAKIYFGDCFTMSVWSANPLILLMLLNLFHQRIIGANPFATIIFGILLILVLILVIHRLFRSFSVVFDKSPIVVYSIGIFVILMLLSSPVLYFYFEHNVFAYFQYIIQVL